MTDSSKIEGFLQSFCEDGDFRTPTGILYQAYRDFCVSGNVNPLGSVAFGRRLAKLGYGSTRNGATRFRTGLRLLESVTKSVIEPEISVTDEAESVTNQAESVTKSDGLGVSVTVSVTPNISMYGEDGEPAPPAHLGPAVAEWWKAIVEEFEDLEEHHLRVLTNACEQWERGQEARQTLAEHGTLSYKNHLGNWVKRPEVDIERQASLAFARLVRELGLDGEEPGEDRLPRGRHA